MAGFTGLRPRALQLRREVARPAAPSDLRRG